MSFTDFLYRAFHNLGPDDPLPPEEVERCARAAIQREAEEAARARRAAEPQPPPPPTPAPTTDPTKVKWVVAHAYTPNEQACYGGGYHLQITVPIRLGRLERGAGDALCRPPKRRHWGLMSSGHDVQISCKACLAIAARLALKGPGLPAPPPA